MGLILCCCLQWIKWFSLYINVRILSRSYIRNQMQAKKSIFRPFWASTNTTEPRINIYCVFVFVCNTYYIYRFDIDLSNFMNTFRCSLCIQLKWHVLFILQNRPVIYFLSLSFCLSKGQDNLQWIEYWMMFSSYSSLNDLENNNSKKN